MEENMNEEITRDEIKKEFQIERMILFSDAVFAIVITLMAIEIKIPESEVKITAESLPKILLHLMPVLLAYIVSFMFIGSIWYQHLSIFSLIKDYDKGLVVRNLVLLFFIGLFPFAASLITRTHGQSLSLFIYVGIIMLCILAQYILYHYIVVKRPQLRINTEMGTHLLELRKRKIALICFGGSILLVFVTYTLIQTPELKSLSSLWMLLVPVVNKILTKKK